MKKKINLDDLDTFLSEAVDEYRMYPSDQVWRNINNKLHRDKRWPSLTLGAIMVSAILIVSVVFKQQSKNIFTPAPLQKHTDMLAHVRTSEKSKVVNFAGKPFSNTISIAGNNARSKNIRTASRADALKNNNATIYFTDVFSSGDLGKEAENNINSHQNKLDQTTYFAKNDFQAIEEQAGQQYFSDDLAENTPARSPQALQAFSPAITNRNADNELKNGFANQIAKIKINQIDNIASTNNNTGASLSLKSASKNKWSMGYYITPSISYRYLDEEKMTDPHISRDNRGPLAPNITNGVNKFVRHKSMTGLEAGANIYYQLTPNLRIKTGLQVNYLAYHLSAFTANFERTAILLNRGIYTDSIVHYSNIGNYEGYKPMQLTNKYWQLSVPIAFDLKMYSSKKLDFYVSGGVQPTYQFSSSSYLLSNDYHNYLQQPQLERKWNINSSLEAFFSYKISSGLSLQAGPQLRYQVLPSTIKEYPIREHLINYGLKIGVVKSFK